jgi:hypothetical protein
MKKIILLVAVFFASTSLWTVAAQCSTGSATWGQYPSATQSAPVALGVETIITVDLYRERSTTGAYVVLVTIPS